jgi:hypothetical protein
MSLFAKIWGFYFKLNFALRISALVNRIIAL